MTGTTEQAPESGVTGPIADTPRLTAPPRSACPCRPSQPSQTSRT